MPLQYGGIVAEHTAVRERAGIFDVSHMGRVQVHGRSAVDLIRSITTFNVTTMHPGEAHYSLYCTEAGGIFDDVFIFRVAEDRWLIVHNAARTADDFERVRRAAGAAARDITAETAMLALQGPEAMAMAAPVLGNAVLGLRPRDCAELVWHGAPVLVARTGYTGEDGIECILPGDAGAPLWEALVAAGATPAGLGARDTLRTEASLPLYGQDIDRTTNPYEAGVGWTVSLDDGTPFIGREALVALRTEPPTRKLVCLRTGGRVVPRHGYPVRTLDGSRSLGPCTSGVYSPTLRTGIAMAYLPAEFTKPGTQVAIEIRERLEPAEVVPRPFYRRPRLG
jgi:aminomethyltransferase